MALCASVALAACSGGGGNDATPAPPAAPSVAATQPPSTPVTPTPTIAPRDVTMRLDAPVPAAPAAGQTFTISVRVFGAANLGAYQFSPAYDSAILELVSVQDGGFLGSTGRSPTCSTEGVPGGQSTFYCVTLGAQPAGPSGDGALAVLEFRALAPGTTDVTLEQTTATMPDAVDLPVTVEAVTVTVAP